MNSLEGVRAQGDSRWWDGVGSKADVHDFGLSLVPGSAFAGDTRRRCTTDGGGEVGSVVTGGVGQVAVRHLVWYRYRRQVILTVTKLLACLSDVTLDTLPLFSSLVIYWQDPLPRAPACLSTCLSCPSPTLLLSLTYLSFLLLPPFLPVLSFPD